MRLCARFLLYFIGQESPQDRKAPHTTAIGIKPPAQPAPAASPPPALLEAG